MTEDTHYEVELNRVQAPDADERIKRAFRLILRAANRKMGEETAEKENDEIR